MERLLPSVLVKQRLETRILADVVILPPSS
jgi:hypothetical protein